MLKHLFTIVSERRTEVYQSDPARTWAQLLDEYVCLRSSAAEKKILGLWYPEGLPVSISYKIQDGRRLLVLGGGVHGELTVDLGQKHWDVVFIDVPGALGTCP